MRPINAKLSALRAAGHSGVVPGGSSTKSARRQTTCVSKGECCYNEGKIQRPPTCLRPPRPAARVRRGERVPSFSSPTRAPGSSPPYAGLSPSRWAISLFGLLAIRHQPEHLAFRAASVVRTWYGRLGESRDLAAQPQQEGTIGFIAKVYCFPEGRSASNGFCRKSTAPARIARTASDTSWRPVTTITGRSTPSACSLSCYQQSAHPRQTDVDTHAPAPCLASKSPAGTSSAVEYSSTRRPDALEQRAHRPANLGRSCFDHGNTVSSAEAAGTGAVDGGAPPWEAPRTDLVQMRRRSGVRRVRRTRVSRRSGPVGFTSCRQPALSISRRGFR